MKVWLVGTCDCETTHIAHVCLSEETAMKRWEEIRKELIHENEEMRDYHRGVGYEWGDDAYNRRIKNLSETDPTKMDNYPQEEPFIRETETED